jgi:hypothetical protein
MRWGMQQQQLLLKSTTISYSSATVARCCAPDDQHIGLQSRCETLARSRHDC